MDILPNLALPRITQSTQAPNRTVLDRLDHVIVILPESPAAGEMRSVPLAPQVKRLLSHVDAGEPVSTRLQNHRATGVTAARFHASSRFEQLTLARKIVAVARRDKPKQIGVLVTGLGAQADAVTTAIIAALLAAAFQMPNLKSKLDKSWTLSAIRLIGRAERMKLDRVEAQAIGNDIARWFTALPPNTLTAQSYRRGLQSLAKTYGFGYEFIDERRLKRLGAGAFLAVSQGNADRDAGIVRLRYRPRSREAAELALVGKGILFDTGGTNLKPFKSMLNMHTDMQGSAVAIGCLVALATLGAPYAIDAWLAVTENRLSPTAYKPQDVVTAANGTTIQTIHTDAEGRMVLADTLALAAREKPAMIIDFATLTGACVGALTEKYSGVFTNRPAANAVARLAGTVSGERVWPFPMDPDYDELLRSDIADVKQCAASGSGDHILAARFLSRFVPAAIPWIHVDLSAGDHKDGLAHIPTEITGFGVGLTLELLGGRSPAALSRELA